jgi:hypothetical protein
MDVLLLLSCSYTPPCRRRILFFGSERTSRADHGTADQQV